MPKWIARFISNLTSAWGILFLCLAFTVLAYYLSWENIYKQAEERFIYETDQIVESISERLQVYEQVLWAGVGLFDASEHVNREEWRAFIKRLNLNEYWPGIQGMGYAVPINPDDLLSHEEDMKGQGFEGYKVRPEGRRDFYTSIIYLEPFDWRNQRAFGYDMWSNEVRREAMKKARESGTAQLSGGITLVQEVGEDVQRGFLLYVPVYKGNPETPQDKMSIFRGWVYSPFRMGDFMENILPQMDSAVSLEIYDGKRIDDEKLLFGSDEEYRQDLDDELLFERSVQMIKQGRVWTIYFDVGKKYIKKQSWGQPIMIAIVGLIFDLLIFYVVYNISSLQRRAVKIAADMNKQLGQRTVELEKTSRSLEDKVKIRTLDLEKVKLDLEVKVKQRTEELQLRMEELERMNKTMTGREVRMIQLKQEIEDLKARISSFEDPDKSDA